MRTLALFFVVTALAACSDRQPAADISPPVDGSTAAATEPTSVTSEAATSPSPPAPPTVADAVTPQTDYLGRWTGVEGMYVVVAANPAGGVTLDMQWDLDNKGTFDGSVTVEGLRFTRNDVGEIAVHTNGEATGLKYLAGKQDCLTVKLGEGYCRD